MTIVTAKGDARSRGVQIGRGLRADIESSIDFYHGYFERRGVSSSQLGELLTPFMIASQQRTPELMSQLTGMAEGATVPVLELFAINAFEELEPLLEPTGEGPMFLERKGGAPGKRPPPAERCTTFAVVNAETTIVGHNEHWLAQDPFVAVVIEEPDDGRPAWLAAPVNVCCLAASGLNSNGVAMGIQSLSADDDREGVPRVLVSRHTLEASDVGDAAARAAMSGRSGGYGYVVAGPDGSAVIETSATGEAVDRQPGACVHTNHYVDPELAASGRTPSEGSKGRLEAMTEAIGASRPTTPEEAMRLLRDVDWAYQAGPDDPPDEDEAIVYSFVAELRSKRMWVALGDPKTTPYEEIDLPS